MQASAVFMLAATAAMLVFGSGPNRFRGARAPKEGTKPDTSAAELSVPLLLELLGTALDSGLAVQGALQVVAAVSGESMGTSLRRVVAGLEIGASWEDSWAGNHDRDELRQIHDALSFGALTGASAAPLLYAQAQNYRTEAARSAQKRAAALGVKLVMPLGLCSLPAFIAVGVVPVVMAMIPAF